MKHKLYKFLSMILFAAFLTVSTSAYAHHCCRGSFSFGFGPAFYQPVYYYQPYYYPVYYHPAYYYPAYYSPYSTECVTVLGHYNRHGRWVPTHKECYEYYN